MASLGFPYLLMGMGYFGVVCVKMSFVVYCFFIHDDYAIGVNLFFPDKSTS